MLREDYTFDASEGTITFTDTVVEADIEVIINATDEVTIFNSVSAVDTGSLSGQVFTLAYDTSSMDDSDTLQIFYGDTTVSADGYTFEELKAKVDTFVDDDVMALLSGDLINQGIDEIAGGMKSAFYDGITPPLPDLFTIGTVNTATDAAYVSMPSNFQRDIQFVATAAGREVDIEHSFIEFAETYPLLDRSGIISAVAEHGGNFYYQGIPTSSEAVTLHYYRKPVAMVVDSDKPDGIPKHLQMSLLVNFACWKSYEHLENGIEGEMPNTMKYKTHFF